MKKINKTTFIPTSQLSHLDITKLILFSMDPRPYHYEYRRPRLSNPTFQSTNLYESLYHRDALYRYQNSHNPQAFQLQSSAFRTQNQSGKSNRSKEYIESYATKLVQKKQSMNDNNSKSILFNNNQQFSRPNSNRSNKSEIYYEKQQKPSILASYGKNSMVDQKQRSLTLQHKRDKSESQNTGAYDKFNQFTVYKKQQKPYNIIGNYSKSTSSELKKYPKLSLQFKLIEEGRYIPQ